MKKLANYTLLFAIALSGLLSAQSAQASQCIPPAYEGDWVVVGSNAAFPGQNTYYMGGVRVGMRCVNAPDEGQCWDDGGERVCSSTSGVRAITTLAIGEWPLSFGGPVEVVYWQPVDAQQGGDGWLYADSTFYGNKTRVWFRMNGATPQVVFEVWINGVYQSPEWRDLQRPIPH